MTTSHPAVLVEGLHKRYGARHAVDGLDLRVEHGEIVAVLGPNGAGKTTTVETLEGFRRADAGLVRVLGEDPATAGRLWRSRIGVVLQDNRDLAESSGTDVQRIILITWVAGASLAALGGILYGTTQTVSWDMGFTILLAMFSAVVLGGLGSAYGAMVGGLVIGMAGEISTYWLETEFKYVIALGVLIVVLLVRPQGICQFSERQHARQVSRNAEKWEPASLGLDGHERSPARRPAILPEYVGEPFDGRSLEEYGERKRVTEHSLELGEETDGQKGMPAQVEEVVADADGVAMEHLLPKFRELDFQGVSRSD